MIMSAGLTETISYVPQLDDLLHRLPQDLSVPTEETVCV